MSKPIILRVRDATDRNQKVRESQKVFRMKPLAHFASTQGEREPMTIDLQQCRENFRQRMTAQQAEREILRQNAHRVAIAAIAQVISHYPQITQIYLFGSVTQPGQFRPQSDIDIAVGGTDASTYFALWRDLETACPNWAIDLREINQPCHFTDIVRQTGELVYESQSSSAQGKY